MFEIEDSCMVGAGNFVVGGVQLGNVWVGVQPALGVEGDPMRLLFERDLTPHPQYAAFYKWLQHDYAADAVLHFGMHGTVEWLPGAPLGTPCNPPFLCPAMLLLQTSAPLYTPLNHGLCLMFGKPLYACRS